MKIMKIGDTVEFIDGHVGIILDKKKGQDIPEEESLLMFYKSKVFLSSPGFYRNAGNNFSTDYYKVVIGDMKGWIRENSMGEYCL